MRLKTDWPLFLTIVGMVSIGLVFVYSASSVVAEQRYGQVSYFFLMRQAVWAFVSFCVLMFLAKRDYRQLESSRFVFFGLGVVLVLLVVVYFADPTNHRWLDLGPGQLQPSELAKPVLIVFLAFFVTQRASDINGWHTVIPATMVLGVLAGAVVIADLGTAIVLMGTAAAVFYVAGLDKRYFWMATGLSILVIMLAIAHKPYRLKRVLDFVDPECKVVCKIDPTGMVQEYASRASVTGDSGYQAKQSRIAIGSGGVFGKGLMMSSQKLFYLPEAHTDFVYAVLAEELGLFGTVLVLCGFIVIMWRGYRLYWVALDDFGKIIAVGATTSLLLQAFINITVVVDLAPTKGIPLPLISYGGSSLLSTMISLGLLLSVSERAR